MKENTAINIRVKHILKAAIFCIVFTGLYVLIYFIKSQVYNQTERLSHAVIGIIAATVTTFLFLRFDKKTFAAIGLTVEKTTLKKFFTGMALGLGLMGLLTMSVIYFSGFTIEANKNSSLLSFCWGTLVLLPLAFMEELGFRAYPLSILKDTTGIRTSIITTSLLFALYHIANGWSLQQAFLGAGVWGILFALTAIRSNGIATPTGMHYAANLTTSFFGINSDSFNLFVLKQKDGSSLENYQSSQLETLIPQLTLLIIGICCMEWYVRKKALAISSNTVIHL